MSHPCHLASAPQCIPGKLLSKTFSARRSLGNSRGSHTRMSNGRARDRLPRRSWSLEQQVQMAAARCSSWVWVPPRLDIQIADF